MQNRKIRSDRWNPADSVVSEIIKKYEGMKSARQLGFEYGVADITITSLLRRRGVNIRNNSDAHRTNQIKEDIFDTINQESAYWIGFILADGNIYHPPNRSKQLNIGLATRDWEHLEKFKKFIGSNKKLYYNKGGVFLSIYSNRIAEKLEEYGIVPRKSKIAKVPDVLKNNRHFWRGMIDGDGWVAVSKTGYPVLGLCGTSDIVEGFVDFVGKNATIGQRTAFCYNVTYGCTSAKIITNRLYENGTIFLHRKYDQFLNIQNWIPQYIQNRSWRCIIR